MAWQQDWLDRYYDRSKGWVDGTTEFHELASRTIAPGQRILEVGAGPANRTSSFLATRGEVWGLDPDPAVLGNDALHRAFVLEGSRFPFDDGAFDAVVSNYVVEHVDDPESHLREVARVVRPGGPYVFRTPNRWHYVALVASLTPHAVHRLVANRARGMGADAHDPYPTRYRMNTASAVRRHAAATGFAVESLKLIEKEPSYGMMARPIFLALLAYERAVNASSAFAGLRANILAVLRHT